MSRVKNLRAEAAGNFARFKAIQAKSDGRAPTTEERAEMERLLAANQKISDQVAAAEVEAERERAEAAAAGPVEDQLHVLRQKQRAGIVLDQHEIETLARFSGAPGVRRARGRTYRELFGAAAIDTGGWSSVEEFLRAANAGLADPRLQVLPRATSTIADPSSGGFSVPSAYFATWLDEAIESTIVLSRAAVRPMQSSEAKSIGFDGADHTDGLYGGLSGAWAAEGEELSLQEPKLRLVSLKAKKLAILSQVSNELASDGMSFEEQLGKAITKALSWFTDRACLSGSGAGVPLGVHNSSATIEVTPESGQAADSILYENVIKMLARLQPSSFSNAIWVANPTTIPQLLSMSITIGTGGAHVPAVVESGGRLTLLTRPLIVSERVPALGERADIGLYDFSQYLVGIRSTFTLAKSVDAGFTRDTSYWRGVVRMDAQPKLNSPVTPTFGDTLSPFVVLGERA